MKRIAYLLKSSHFLYSVYFYLFSGLLRLLGIFVRTDEKLILFNSYGGKKIDDSPLAIFYEMQKDKRFSEFRKVWAVQEPDDFDNAEGIEIIKADSFRYFLYALQAKIWITNSSIERGLSFKKSNTICLNTWHGTTIKKMGIDIQGDNQSFRSKTNVCADIMLAQSQYDIDIFSHAFELPRENFRCIGLPRNDVLANYSEEDVNNIKKKLGISTSKKVLLYAPTFREYTKGKDSAVIQDIPMNLAYWQEKLGMEYIVLFRAHYEVARHMEVSGYPAFKDVSTYPNLNELMIISDALISDYSSIYFDYSVMHKPMYCYAYDYEQYMSKRGMYLDLRDELPCEMHQSEECLLLDISTSADCVEKKIVRVIEFQKKFVTEYGNAAKKSCDALWELLIKK